jgi:ribosome-associated heat shock protein Hsp15
MSSIENVAAVRLDKWLWAARFFKTRGMAAEAVAGGKVHVNGVRTKPAKQTRIGDRLSIRRGMYDWTVTVLAVTEKRRPAPEAARLYAETVESVRERERIGAAARAARASAGGAPAAGGRPSKKARRDLDRFTRDRDDR